MVDPASLPGSLGNDPSTALVEKLQRELRTVAALEVRKDDDCLALEAWSGLDHLQVQNA